MTRKGGQGAVRVSTPLDTFQSAELVMMCYLTNAEGAGYWASALLNVQIQGDLAVTCLDSEKCKALLRV